MNRQQQQALAELQLANAKGRHGAAMDAIAAATDPTELDRAVTDARNAKHAIERAENVIYS